MPKPTDTKQARCQHCGQDTAITQSEQGRGCTAYHGPCWLEHLREMYGRAKSDYERDAIRGIGQ
jgi:hypothetical protein